MSKKQLFRAATETIFGIGGFVGAMFDMWRRSRSKNRRMFGQPKAPKHTRSIEEVNLPPKIE